MFGDFFLNFGLNFPHLGADRAGGMFGGVFDPEKAMRDTLTPQQQAGGGMPGAGMGPGGPQMPAGKPGAEPAPGASTVGEPPPTASGVAHAPMTVAGSALQPGGGSPLGPLGPGLQPQPPSDRLTPGGELAELLRKSEFLRNFEPRGIRAQ